MTDPCIGTRFSITSGLRGAEPNIYEFIGEQPDVDPVYRYGLKLVSTSDLARRNGYVVGDVMFVERQWFDVRGEMPAKSEGAVRRVKS